MSFKYQLEASTPQRFGGGTLRTVTRKNIPSLRDMALYSESIDPGSLREVHWHPNAGELAYCLEGQGAFGILSPIGDNDTFHIDAGSVSVPRLVVAVVCLGLIPVAVSVSSILTLAVLVFVLCGLAAFETASSREFRRELRAR
jgi:hypothetical protein